LGRFNHLPLHFLLLLLLHLYLLPRSINGYHILKGRAITVSKTGIMREIVEILRFHVLLCLYRLSLQVQVTEGEEGTKGEEARIAAVDINGEGEGKGMVISTSRKGATGSPKRLPVGRVNHPKENLSLNLRLKHLR